MERLDALISRLTEQYRQNAGPEKMLLTLQLLQNELTNCLQASKSLGTSKVSVVLPPVLKVEPTSNDKYAPKPVEKPAVKEVREKVLVDHDSVSIVKNNGQLDMVFDPMVEIPTLSNQLRGKKNDEEPESLNDRLRQSKAELVEVLKEAPIRDLRKAIGVNDRFLFINDLFRGDEAMYERSIKTINSFNIYPEAEYWITRELKIKLGWDADLPAVRQFDQLIKRRFS